MLTETRRFPFWLGATLTATFVALLAGGIWVFRTDIQQARRNASANLSSIARLKVEQIQAWRSEQLQNGAELSQSYLVTTRVAGHLASPQGATTARLMAQFQDVAESHAFVDVVLLDSRGHVLMGLGGRAAVAPEVAAGLTTAIRSRVPVMTEPYLDTPSGTVRIGVVAPVIGPDETPPQPTAALVLVSDAERSLYRIVQSWPTESRTAETLLVRRDGNDALYLNNLRHRTGAALRLRVPLSRADVPAVMAILGHQGFFEGTDYRGVPVVSVVLPVPGSTWLMVAKMDQSEVFAQWRKQAVSTLVALGALLFGVIAIAGVAWHRRTQTYYHSLYRSEAALRTSVERHSITLRSIGDAVIATDARGLVELLNPVAETLTGWTNDDARGRPLEDIFRIVHEGTRLPLDNPVARVLTEGVVVALANHTLLISRDGTERPIADSGAPILNHRGDVTGVVLVFRDQTGERQKERALRDSEEKFRAVFESSSDAALLMSSDRCFDCNEAAVKLYGAPSKARLCELGPLDVSPLTQPDGQASAVAAAAHIQEAMEHGGAVDFEWMHKRLDTGEEFPTEVRLARTTIDGRPMLQANVRDITERKRLERALQQRIVALTRPLDQDAVVTLDELFDLGELQRIQDEFAEATGVASIITRPDGTPITRPSRFTHFCNDIVRMSEKGRLNCYRSDAALGGLHPDGPIIQPCLSGGLWDAGASITVGNHHIANWLIGQVRDTTQTEESMRVYARTIGVDEETLVEAFRDVPTMSREQFNKVARALFTLANQLSASAYQNVQQARFIADWTQSEAERGQLQEQLLQAQKMESVGRLAGGVAHDFNNMLAAILGYTELALTKPELPDSIRGDLVEIQTAAQRSADLTKQLLAFARKQTIMPRVIDLNDTIAGMLKMVRRLIGEHIDLTWHPGADLWPVKVDPNQIDQILTNLCVNARDAIADVGKVVIETGRATFDADYCAEHPGYAPGEFVSVSVGDDGAGMSREVQDHLFEPFFTTKGLGEGTGLGLATIYGIVKQNDGFINVYSELEHGTTFRIYLPRYQGAVEGDAAETLPELPVGRGHETVLLVEDEPSMLSMARTALEKFGYRVLAAGAPGEALRLAEAFPGTIDVLLTDVVMPEMNGRDLATRLVAQRPDIVCVFMSGYTADLIADRGVLDEGVTFIQKPFAVTALGHTIRRALARH